MYKSNAPWFYLVIGAILIVFGLGSFFMTLCADPGIPSDVYYRRARPFAKKPQLADMNE